MTKKVNKNKQVSLRISSEIHSKLTTYADAHGLTLTDTCVRLIEKGLKSEYEQVATKDDLQVIKAEIEALEAKQQTSATLLLDAIKNQPIAVQPLPAPADQEQEEAEKQGFFKRLFS